MNPPKKSEKSNLKEEIQRISSLRDKKNTTENLKKNKTILINMHYYAAYSWAAGDTKPSHEDTHPIKVCNGL